MFWVIMALLVVAGGVLLRRQGRRPDPDEPWRASLHEEDDEPLDMDEIRRAEEEWLTEEEWAEDAWREGSEDEEWK